MNMFFAFFVISPVSGISFAFDPRRPPYARIISELVQVADEWLDTKQTYSLCIKSYMHGGCDGFTMFKDAKVIVSCVNYVFCYKPIVCIIK